MADPDRGAERDQNRDARLPSSRQSPSGGCRFPVSTSPRHRVEAASVVGLGIDPQTVGEAVVIVEQRRDLDDVVNGHVTKAMVA